MAKACLVGTVMSGHQKNAEDSTLYRLVYEGCLGLVWQLIIGSGSRLSPPWCRVIKSENSSSYPEVTRKLLGQWAGLLLELAIVAFGVGRGDTHTTFPHAMKKIQTPKHTLAVLLLVAIELCLF